MKFYSLCCKPPIAYWWYEANFYWCYLVCNWGILPPLKWHGYHPSSFETEVRKTRLLNVLSDKLSFLTGTNTLPVGRVFIPVRKKS